MDFRKAFDSVSHDRLLQKLWNNWNSLEWFQAGLRQRYQFVKFGDSFLNLCNILSGVPHGSVLGPLLQYLSFFINDLPEHIQFAIPFIFADNTKCLSEIRSDSDTEKLQIDSKNAFNWSITSELFQLLHLRFWAKDTADHPLYNVNGHPI